MLVLFDSNIWIKLLKGRDSPILSRWQQLAFGDLVVCSIVQAELWHGALKYAQPAARREVVDHWLSPYESLPFDARAADYYATIRHDLELRGEIIGPNDLKIAAICLAHDLTLVTGNISEFSRVRGLRVENWSAPAT